MLILNCRSWSKEGGHQRRLIHMVNYFAEFGIIPHIIEYSQFSSNYGENEYSITRIHRLFSEGILGEFFRMIYLTIFCLKFFRKKNLDAIYLDKMEPFENTFPSLIISKFFRKPLIISKQEIPLNISSKKRFSIWKNSGVKLYIIFWRLLTDPFKNFVFKEAEVILCVSKQVAIGVKQQFNNQTYISGNGVNLKNFEQDSSVPKLFEACYLGRLNKQKGIEVLLKSWKIVADSYPEARLLMIGGEKKEVSRYKRVVKNLNIPPNIFFVEWESSEKNIARKLNSSKLFVFPSRTEGFPLSVLEAMACGLCCIISDIPVLRDNFSNAADFVNPESPTDFSARIIHYLINEDERIKLSIAAKEFAKKFDWKYIAQSEATIITKVVRRTKYQ